MDFLQEVQLDLETSSKLKLAAWCEVVHLTVHEPSYWARHRPRQGRSTMRSERASRLALPPRNRAQSPQRGLCRRAGGAASSRLHHVCPWALRSWSWSEHLEGGVAVYRGRRGCSRRARYGAGVGDTLVRARCRGVDDRRSVYNHSGWGGAASVDHS